jgi:DNA-binding NarL/FixJ family response regulator
MAGSFLIVEDDPLTARAIWRHLHEFRQTTIATSGTEARKLLAEPHAWCGFLFDNSLGDDHGLDILEFARERYPFVPAVIVSALNEPALINRAFTLRAGYMCKPVHRGTLLHFVQRAMATEHLPGERFGELVEDLTRRHNLSPRETELLIYAVSGSSREEILREKNISPNTLKSQVRQLLRKFSAEDLDKLAVKVLRLALTDDESRRAS